MDKKRVLEAIRERLRSELAALTQAAQAAHAAATHEESQSEDRHDTRSIEAGYLAGAQAQRVAELQSQMDFYQRYEPRDYSDGSLAVGPGALVQVENEDGKESLYFLAPSGGGLTLQLEGTQVQVITPQSPFGEELNGRKLGESFEIETRGQSREYEIVAIS